MRNLRISTGCAHDGLELNDGMGGFGLYFPLDAL